MSHIRRDSVIDSFSSCPKTHREQRAIFRVADDATGLQAAKRQRDNGSWLQCDGGSVCSTDCRTVCRKERGVLVPGSRPGWKHRSIWLPNTHLTTSNEACFQREFRNAELSMN